MNISREGFKGRNSSCAVKTSVTVMGQNIGHALHCCGDARTEAFGATGGRDERLSGEVNKSQIVIGKPNFNSIVVYGAESEIEAGEALRNEDLVIVYFDPPRLTHAADGHATVVCDRSWGAIIMLLGSFIEFRRGLHVQGLVGSLAVECVSPKVKCSLLLEDP